MSAKNEGETFVRAPMGYSAIARACNRLGLALALALVAGLSGGCSLTMHLTSLSEDSEMTASIPTRAVDRLDPSLDDEDWRRASSALSLAVDPQGPGLAVNWDNPLSKRKGSFAAAGDLVLSQETICRPFTASVFQPGGKESKHTGQACRLGPGEWSLRSDTAPAPKAALNQPLPLPTTPTIAAPSLAAQEKAR